MTTIARYAVVCPTVGAACAMLSMLACGPAAEADARVTRAGLASLPALDIDEAETSASGLSSGAFMAVQFHVAFSASMRGVAAFAGGPYGCARGSVSEALTTCMSSSSRLDVAPFVAMTRANAAEGTVDDVAHLAGQRIFLFGGDKDTTVNPAVMDGLRDYYARFVSAGDIAFVRRRAGTAHTMPTEDWGVACGTTASPYVGRCGYDGAGAALAHIYGPLAPRASSATGAFLTVPQADFVASPDLHSLAESAYVYVPASCAAGERCRIHVAFHGCQQSASVVGDAFYKHAGYNEWAETNRLVVVYPQTIAKKGQNPNACWDWWGYDSPDYAKKTGPQMKMVKGLVDALASGTGAGPDAGAGDAASPDASADAGAPAPTDACTTASNAEHVAAGRASAWFGFAFAKGSGQSLGLATTFVRTALRRVAGGAYVLC